MPCILSSPCVDPSFLTSLVDSLSPPCCCPDPAPDLRDDIQLEKEITSRVNCLAAPRLLPAVFVRENTGLLFTATDAG